MHQGISWQGRATVCVSWACAGLLSGVLLVQSMLAHAQDASAPKLAEGASRCEKPIYLTFDTGHMGVAPLVSDVLRRHGIRATFFMANEKTQTGGTSLDSHWRAWWQERVQEGHAFGSHTFDHVYWLADTSKGFRVKASSGDAAGKVQEWTPQQYCEEIKRTESHFKSMTGRDFSQISGKKLFRAPGGKTSAKLLQTVSQCGFVHVGWSAAGFLGDELPSGRYPNKQLLDQALAKIQTGDVLLAHLGIWSRQDPWAPAVLEPLVVGLKARGLCFQTLAHHDGSLDAALRGRP